MLRSLLIYLSKAGWARKLVTQWAFAWRAASRFVAGETLADGIRAIQNLNQKGILATLDNLGEHTTNAEEAQRATKRILEMIAGIAQAGVRANVSIKLSQIGLGVSEELCAANLETILRAARAQNLFVRIDMEESSLVDVTLGLYRKMYEELGLDNTGVVLQAYLYRTEADVQAVANKGGRVRLCKGAYKEPAEVAYPKKADVDRNYDLQAKALMDASQALGCPRLSADGKTPPIPAIASHDPCRLEAAKAYATQIGLPKDAIEFQMLYGIRRDLQEETAREGYPVRIYVPYGTEWYPYYMRRLAERPANVWFFISNFFRK